MRLNPTKCKEMHINFLRNSNCLINPIIIGGNVIKRVNTYKILGVIVDNDLKWNCHADYIIKKACKKLQSLRVLRRAGVSQPNILRIYFSNTNTIINYLIRLILIFVYQSLILTVTKAKKPYITVKIIRV